MSRIGKLPIEVPAGVTIQVDQSNMVTVSGPLGKLTQQVHPEIDVKVEGSQITIARPTDEKNHRSLHGLYRSLIYNMVFGVSQGFEVKLELVGVGYRAENQGQLLDLVLGYSHHIFLQLPAEVSINAVTDKRSNPTITMKSHDKQLLGMVTAKIRSFRKPEPYKGKGIKFVGEVLRRKSGKSAGAK
jgi:large subunit ribosomal protein L6